MNFVNLFEQKLQTGVKMNILFLTLLDFNTIHEAGIYQDLMYEFENHGHKVYILSPVERKKAEKTHFIKDGNTSILKLKIGNIQKTNVIEKGISTILIESIFIAGLKKYFSDVKFHLVLYSTPPITLCNAVEYIKKRDHAKTYLLLKDIFPQNAVDIGMMSKKGGKRILYRFFRTKEKKIYRISDYIGCMSQANADYVIGHNSDVNPGKVEVCPNSIKVVDKSISAGSRKAIRDKYGIPQDRKVFIYGGNLGKPQGIDFLIKCIHSQRNNPNIFLLVIGDGTEYRKLKRYAQEYPQNNFKLMRRLPKEDYDAIVAACDVGLIFLDYRFTIPNFPSRLLSYMQVRIPVLACTDENTDLGQIIVDKGFGWWCKSNDVKMFHRTIKEAMNSDLKIMGEKAFQCLNDDYKVEDSYEIIMGHFVNSGSMEK